MTVNPRPVAHICKRNDNYYPQRGTDIGKKTLERAEINLRQEQQHTWKNSKEHHIQHRRKRKEAGSFGILGIEYITHHGDVQKDIVCIYKIETYSITNQCGGHYAPPDYTSGIQKKVIKEVVCRQHQHHKTGNNQHGVKTAFQIRHDIPEKRNMICDQSKRTQKSADKPQTKLSFFSHFYL